MKRGLRSPSSRSGDLSATAALERYAELEKLDALKGRIRATSYGLGGMDWGALFSRYDVDRSGELEIEEFVAALKKVASSASLTEEDLRHLFAQVDTDGSGLVDAAEFTAFMQITPDELARKAVRDSNGHGTQEYIVMAPCILREQPDLSSLKLGHLGKGEVVAVTDKRGNRLRISRLKFSSIGQPQTGWVSEIATGIAGSISGDEAEPRRLLAKLDRAEGQMGRYATEREEAEGTQRRLTMLAQDKKWADRAHKENAAARRRRRRQSSPSRRLGSGPTVDGRSSRRAQRRAERHLRPNAPEAGSGSRQTSVQMSEAEHQLYGEIAATALAECDVLSGDRTQSSPAEPKATRLLLLSLLEHTPRWRWGRAIEREWPVLKQELLTLLTVSESDNSAAADEAVASAMLRWRQEREASSALRGNGVGSEDEAHIRTLLSHHSEQKKYSKRATTAANRVLAPLDDSRSGNVVTMSTSNVSIGSTSKGALFCDDGVSIDGSDSSVDTRAKYSSVDRVLRRRRRLVEGTRGQDVRREKSIT